MTEPEKIEQAVQQELVSLIPKDKLLRLAEFMPSHEETLYEFSRFLADRVYPEHSQDSELLPEGFVMAATLAIHDLETGIDGFTGKPIESRLASMPEMIYGTLHLFIPHIARAIYPKEFADKVQAIYDKVYKKTAESAPAEPEINLAAAMPGKDPFEMLDKGERLPKEGILVHAHIWKSSHGTFTVYEYRGLVRYNRSDSRPKYDSQRLNVEFEWDEKSKQIAFAYEHPEYPGKIKEPFNRGDSTTYLPFGWEELDVINLPSGGRLLTLKEPWLIGNLYTSFDKKGYDLQADSPRREVLSYFELNDSEGAVDCVRVIAKELIGLPTEDVEKIASEVKARLQIVVQPKTSA